MKTSLLRCLAVAVLAGVADAFLPLVGHTTTGGRQVSSSSSLTTPLVVLRDRLTADEEVQQEAQEKLSNVGWALPNTDGDLTADDPFVQQIDAQIMADVGVPLDALLNPAKVVNLERDLYQLRSQLAEATGVDWDAILQAAAETNEAVVTAVCDGGGGGADADTLRSKIQKKEADLTIERRSVFRGWLKNVFLVQAVLSFGLSYVMATEPQVLFGGFGWFYSNNMDVSIQVLGYWWWWLFVVPSLRSRRPQGAEKKALDIAFIGTPLISLVAPVATKDTAVIWALNLAVVAAAYGYAFLLDGDDDGEGGDDEDGTPGWLKFAFKSLDFGSGRERGARN
jgi:hypothetical protein